MPTFTYTAKTSPAKSLQGQMQADSKQEVINRLSRMGYFPVCVNEQNLTLRKDDIFSAWKVPGKDVVQFTRQLSSLSASGVNILNSLDTVLNQTANKYLKAALFDVIAKIKDGKALSDSLSEHSSIFPQLYTAVVRSGELSGSLDAALKRLAEFLENEQDFRNSLRQAMLYPMFVMGVSVLTIFTLFVFVIPRLVTMFQDMGQALPAATRFLITISSLLRQSWWMIFCGVFMSFFLAKRFAGRTQSRLFIDELKLKIPLLRNIVLKAEIARFSRTLSLSLSSGLQIVQGLDISIPVVTNQALKNQLQKAKSGISGGDSFSSCLKESALFPAFVANIIVVGEESGTLEKSLMRIAEDYEKDVDRYMKAVTRLLEPVIILVMGLIVLFIVLAMLLPIFQINLMVR